MFDVKTQPSTPNSAFQFSLVRNCASVLEFFSSNHKSSLFRNRKNCIGISCCFEFVLKAGVPFDFFQEHFELFFDIAMEPQKWQQEQRCPIEIKNSSSSSI